MIIFRRIPLPFAALAVLLLCCAAHAQDSDSSPAALMEPHYRRLDIVTLAQPTVRQACHVKSADTEKIVCVRPLQTAKVYLRSEIAALIEPADVTPIWLWFAGYLSAGGAAVYGAVVVTSALATAGLVTAAVILLASALLAPMMADGDYGYDRLVYLRPGVTLEAPLHTAAK